MKGGKMSIASILKGHEFFHNLGMEEVEEVSGFSEQRTFKREAQIYGHAEKADKVYLLLEGSVFLRLPPGNGNAKLIIAKVEKGELFGISPLLGAERYAVDAFCAEKAEVLAIEARRLQRMLTEDCVAGFVIMSEVAKAYFDRYTELLRKLQSVVSGLL
jgi:signal-transduction protein with cAMP-binding, CBS, and nucleotidyltransferase domain